MKLKFLGKHRESGLLFLRFGIGILFLFHGAPKLLGGPAKWESLGYAARHVGVYHWPVVWGFVAAVAEFFGGIALILGFYFRPACLLLAGVMTVASAMHLGRGEGLLAASHAIECGILFFSLMLIGPGKYSLDRG